jgi:hypothetical protein
MSCPDPESEHDADHGPSGEGSDGAGVPLESRAKRAIATDPGQDFFDDPALAPDQRSSSRGEVEKSAEDGIKIKNAAIIMQRAAKMRSPMALIQRCRRGRVSRAYAGSCVAAAMGTGRAIGWFWAAPSDAGVLKRRP